MLIETLSRRDIERMRNPSTSMPKIWTLVCVGSRCMHTMYK